MSKELAMRGQGLEMERGTGQSVMEIIARASADPTCDVGKMKALIDMQKDLMAFEAKAKYNQAMIACQHEMQPVVKNCTNPETHSKFANLEAVDLAIKPIYQKHGFAVSVHNPQIIDGLLVVSALVLHTGGHSETYSVQFANDMKGPKGGAQKTEIQGAVSTISYGTRVLKCKIFDITIVGSDRDGSKPTQYITQDQCDSLQNFIEEAAGSPQRAVGLTASILRVTGAKMLSEISTALHYTAIEFAKLALERRLKGGAA